MNKTKKTYKVMLFVAIVLLIISIVYNAMKLTQFSTKNYEYTFEKIMIIFSCLLLLICVYVFFIYYKKTELQKKNKAVIITLTILTIILVAIRATKTNEIPFHYFRSPKYEFGKVPYIERNELKKIATISAEMTYYNIRAMILVISNKKYVNFEIFINSKKPLVYPIYILATLFDNKQKELYEIPFTVESSEPGKEVFLSNTDKQVDFDQIHSVQLQISSDLSKIIYTMS